MALRKGLPWYQPSRTSVTHRGELGDCTISMVEARYPGAKAEPWEHHQEEGLTDGGPDGPGGLPIMTSIMMRGCCIFCGSGMGLAPPSVDSGHDSVTPGFKGLSMGSCPNISRVEAEGGCKLCDGLVKA